MADLFDEIEETSAPATVGTDLLSELELEQPPVVQVASEPVTQESTLVSRVVEDLAPRQERFAEDIGEFVSQPSTGAAKELVANLAGEAAWGAMDVAGEAIVTGAKNVANMAPEEVKDFVSEGYKTLINAIPSEVKLALSSGTTDVIDKYQELEKINPKAMRQVENLLGVLTLAAPAPKANPAAKPGIVGKVGQKVGRKGKLQSGTQKREAILDLIRPDKVAKKEVAADIRRTRETGILRSAVKSATAQEKAIARDVAKVPGINTKQGLLGRNELHAANKINDHITNVTKSVRDDLSRMSAPAQSMRTRIATDIDSKVSGIVDESVFLRESKKPVEQLVKKAKSLMQAADDTPLGIWEARKAYDEWVGDSLGNFPDNLTKQLDLVNKAIRDSMNASVHTEARRQGVNTQAKFRTLHNLLQANEVVSAKADKLGANLLVRAGENVRKVVGARSAAMGLAAALLGTTVIGASQMVAAPVGIAIGGGIASALAFKALAGPGAKRGVAALLTATDDAIRIATDPVMVQQLRADRALLVELSKHLKEEENEGK